jgi:hypothetical protein
MRKLFRKKQNDEEPQVQAAEVEAVEVKAEEPAPEPEPVEATEAKEPEEPAREVKTRHPEKEVAGIAVEGAVLRCPKAAKLELVSVTDEGEIRVAPIGSIGLWAKHDKDAKTLEIPEGVTLRLKVHGQWFFHRPTGESAAVEIPVAQLEQRLRSLRLAEIRREREACEQKVRELAAVEARLAG